VLAHPGCHGERVVNEFVVFVIYGSVLRVVMTFLDLWSRDHFFHIWKGIKLQQSSRCHVLMLAS